MKKCKYCGGQMEDYQSRCNECGQLQPKEVVAAQPKEEEYEKRLAYMKTPCPPLVTGWLWLMIVFGVLLALAEMFPKQAWGADYPENMVLFSRLSSIPTILIVVGAAMLLMRMKMGFYIICACSFIGAIVNMATGTVPIGLVGLVILFLILQRKSSDVPYWKTLE